MVAATAGIDEVLDGSDSLRIRIPEISYESSKETVSPDGINNKLGGGKIIERRSNRQSQQRYQFATVAFTKS